MFVELGTGPARARNVGAKLATGSWLLFTDSDCEPTNSWVKGFIPALNGSIAYAGGVRAKGSDRLSRYYDTQRTLVPPPGRPGYPAYLVTANALVWRVAFDAVGGFDERFPYAAGEDIDFGLRLWRIGDISYAPEALVVHDFEPTWTAFVSRFIRYGRGNRFLAAHYGASLRPRPFVPASLSWFNAVASVAQYVSMTLGYEAERIWRRRADAASFRTAPAPDNAKLDPHTNLRQIGSSRGV
ncbi:MAG: glycosyltransferase family 2 protein [Minicystis sp.]